MKKVGFSLLLILTLSCRENEITPDTFLSLSAEGEAAVINNDQRTLTLKLGENASWSAVGLNFSATGNASLEIGGKPVTSGSTVDLSKTDAVELKSGSGVVRSYTLKKTSVWEDFGMGKNQERFVSLNRTYSFYLDQYGTGTHQYINCGPTVVTMALRWSDSTFQHSALDARNSIRAEGGWWYTTDIYSYLHQFGVTAAYYSLPTSLSLSAYQLQMMNIIDRGHLAILCLDMFYVKENTNPENRANRFYTANSQGWGHFILVKGYRVIDGKVWLEIHDPYSIAKKYMNGQLKGDRRYYDPAEIKKATDIWWPYAIVIPRKDGSTHARLKTVQGDVPAQKGR